MQFLGINLEIWILAILIGLIVGLTLAISLIYFGRKYKKQLHNPKVRRGVLWFTNLFFGSAVIYFIYRIIIVEPCNRLFQSLYLFLALSCWLQSINSIWGWGK